jgi:rhodanese-related sulfurtransferase
VAGALVRRPVNQTAAVECDRRSGKERIMTSSIQELVAQARSQIRDLTVDEFARELEADTVTLIDIREPDEGGRAGAIPGAIQAPCGMLEFWADPADSYHSTEFDPRRAPCSAAHRAVAQRWPSRASEPSATPTSRTWTAD